MFKLAIKNVLRYKTRSILTALVIMVSAIATVFIMGFMDGMMEHILNGYVNYQTGHVRITTKEYLEKEKFMPLYESMTDIEAFQKELEKDERVAQVVPMFRFGSFIGMEDETLPVSVVAFDLQNNTFGVNEKLIEGESVPDGIVIGKGLQEKFDLSMGDKPLIVATTVDSALNGTKPEITGVSQFGMSMFDKSSIFMNLQTAQRLLRLEDSAAEIWIRLENEKKVDNYVEDLQVQYPDLAIESYKAQMGAFYITMKIEENILIFVAMIIMFLGSLVIINSLIASIYERINEIGMFKALGYTDKELTKMLFFEGSVFGIFAGGLGFIIGLIAVNYFTVQGIDFSALMGSLDMPIETVIYPSVTVGTALISAIVAILIPAIVSLIPARTMKRLSVVEALNHKN